MPYDPEKHHRRSIRVQGYDYASPGGYFMTLCVQHGRCLLGEVIDGVMHLNDAGRMVEAIWASLPKKFDHLAVDAHQVMPNHLHGILVLLDDWSQYTGGARRGEPRVRPPHRDGHASDDPDHPDDQSPVRPAGTVPGTVGRIIQAFKTTTTNAYIDGVRQQGWSPFHRKLWQRNYWDRIIRDGNEWDRIQRYIIDNPLRWHFDRLNPDRRS